MSRNRTRPRKVVSYALRYLALTVVALLGYATGLTLLGQIAIGFALVAALLNAIFRFCLGCEMYLLIKRVTH